VCTNKIPIKKGFPAALNAVTSCDAKLELRRSEKSNGKSLSVHAWSKKFNSSGKFPSKKIAFPYELNTTT
jgi:hypothetical protein